MQINRTLKIKEKYFNAILKLEKPFELRHEEIPENSIVKLECENGRYLIFKSGKCELLRKEVNWHDGYQYEYNKSTGRKHYIFNEEYGEEALDPYGEWTDCYDWYDDFCWEYITKAPTYLIEIAEILEVK